MLLYGLNYFPCSIFNVHTVRIIQSITQQNSIYKPRADFILLCERWKQRSNCGGSDGYVTELPQFICHSKIYSSTNFLQM